MTYAYDPELTAVVAALPPLDLSDIPAARARVQAATFVRPDAISIEKRMVPGRPGDPDIKVAICRPVAVAANAPALYWIHGGGFVLGDVDRDIAIPARIADELGAIVVSAENRLAPAPP